MSPPPCGAAVNLECDCPSCQGLPTPKEKTVRKNSKKNIPVAACTRCGGWTSYGGMSQHSKSTVPVSGRTGCDCIKPMKCGGCGTCAKCVASQGRAEERAVD